MAKIHTHYDNLKVARNAPPEVIRAAYKTLSQRFHPDRNAGNEGATRIFQIINSAYEVLSDPVKRKAHDDWIAQVEAQAQAEGKPAEDYGTSARSEKPAFQSDFSRFSGARYDRAASSLTLAFKGLTVKQRNFIFLFSGLILALIIFIIVVG